MQCINLLPILATTFARVHHSYFYIFRIYYLTVSVAAMVRATKDLITYLYTTWDVLKIFLSHLMITTKDGVVKIGHTLHDFSFSLILLIQPTSSGAYDDYASTICHAW